MYLVGVATIQLAMYSAALVWGRRLEALFYFDPRIGLFMIESIVRGETIFPGGLSWLSAGLLGAVGLAVVRNPARVETYRRAEAVMAAPSMLMFVLVALNNLSPSHGFSVGELLGPAPVFLVASVVPYVWGYRLSKRLVDESPGALADISEGG